MRILLTILFVLCGQVVLSCAAIADYIVPPVAEDYTLIPDSWKLTKTSLLGDFDRLEVIHKGKTYVWTIDRFLLADRTDSNTICCGTYMNFTRNYLEKISKAQPNGVVRVEVVTAQKAGELKVAGIWLVDFKQSWDRAIQQGSRVLNLSAEEVRKFKSPEGYERKIREFSNQQWDRLASRQ